MSLLNKVWRIISRQTLFIMAKNTAEAEVVITMNGKAAVNALADLKKQQEKCNDAVKAGIEAQMELDKLKKTSIGDYQKVEGRSYVQQMEHLKGLIKKGKESQATLNRLTKEIQYTERETKKFAEILEDINGSSLKELQDAAKKLKFEIRNLAPDTEKFAEKTKQLQQVNTRIDEITKSFKGVTVEQEKTGSGFKRLSAKLSENFGAIAIYARTVRKAIRAIVAVTKEVVNASQTMGDKWNNAMSAMKTSTDAFFMALSTGDWSAFNDGLAEALKKARELAELEDLLGSFRIAEGYIQSKDIVDIQNARNTATDTEADIEQRKQALEDMKAAIERYNEFVTAKGEATYQDLIKSFDAWKGITFNSEEEFKSFFDRLFRYSTTNRDEELARAQKSYEYTWKNLSARHKDAYGQIVQDYTAAEAKEIALEQVTKQYGEETAKLLQAVEINDEKHTKLVQTYAQYANSVQVVNQQTRTYQRTRDQVNKQLYSEEIKQLQKANNVTLNIWKAQYAKGIIDKATFEAKKLELERQAQQQSIELANKYGQDATDLYTKQLDDIIKQMEDEAKKAADAADKAYQAAMKRVEKQESEQKQVWKRQYANGLIDKQNYEAQIAVVEEDFLKQKMATAEKYGKDTDQFMSQLLDRQIARMDKAKALLKEEMEEMAKAYIDEHPDQNMSDEDFSKLRDSQRRQGYKEKLGTIPGETDEEFDARIEQYEAFQEKILAKAADIRAAITEDSARTQYETEMKWIEKLHKDGLLSDEEFEKAKMDQKLGFAAKIAQEVNRYAEMASNFANALKESETAKMEAEYQAQLTAAGDNAEERERIEAEYEQKKLDMQKKYADVDMVINIAKAIASGALAAVEAFAAAGGNPVLGGIFAAIIAATTAIEIATIVSQRNAIKNASVSGGGSSSAPKTGERKMTGYAEGGYTEDHTTLTTVGEKGREWVGPAWMVRKNPVMFANLERYRKSGSHGRSGSMSRGFADGGFTPGKGGGSSATMPEQIDIEAAVEAAIRRVMADGAIRAYVVRKDIEELDAQTLKFKKLGSR